MGGVDIYLSKIKSEILKVGSYLQQPCKTWNAKNYYALCNVLRRNASFINDCTPHYKQHL